MNFEPINFLEKLIPFLESSPFGIENIQVIPFSQQTMSQLAHKNINGLTYGGHTPPQMQWSANGTATIQNQANFYLQFLQRFVDETGNAEATSAVANFEQWIASENVRNRQAQGANKNPLFPVFGDDPISYSMLADGGALIMSNLETAPYYAVYQVNIRIKYKIIYEREW